MKNKDKAVIVAVAFVAMIAVVGTMTWGRYETRKNKEIAEKETEEIKEIKETKEASTPKVEAEIVSEEEIESEKSVPVSKEPEPDFSERETIIWPVDGTVILNYSMDQPVYFATLDQYKYNPGILISGELGEPVLAAADGRVDEIKKDAQLGNVLVIDMGNGYRSVYGQMQEIRPKEGQRVRQGEVVGYLENPTKYYSVEGCNLFFQMLKNETPVNPLEYIEE